jgi:hypothetical protein
VVPKLQSVCVRARAGGGEEEEIKLRVCSVRCLKIRPAEIAFVAANSLM